MGGRSGCLSSLMAFAAGTRVTISGLKTVELNGQTGLVEGSTVGLDGMPRYKVKLPDGSVKSLSIFTMLSLINVKKSMPLLRLVQPLVLHPRSGILT